MRSFIAVAACVSLTTFGVSNSSHSVQTPKKEVTEFYVPVNNVVPEHLTLSSTRKSRDSKSTTKTEYRIELPSNLTPSSFNPASTALDLPEWDFRCSLVDSDLSITLGFNYFSGSYAATSYLAVCQAMKYRFEAIEGATIKVLSPASSSPPPSVSVQMHIGVGIRSEFEVQSKDARLGVSVGPLDVTGSFKTTTEKMFVRAMGFTNYKEFNISTKADGFIDGSELRKTLVSTFNEYMKDLNQSSALRPRILGLTIRITTPLSA